jgi:hypothetical protein
MKDIEELEESISVVSDKYVKIDIKTIKKSENKLFKQLEQDRSQNAEEYIQLFKENFLKLYGISPIIIYTLKPDIYYPISLENLENICNAFIDPNERATIRDRNRARTIVLARHIFFYVACKMKYTTVFLASYLGWHHASIVHAKKTINTALEVNDFETISKIKIVYDEIEKRIRANTIVQSNDKGEPIS